MYDNVSKDRQWLKVCQCHVIKGFILLLLLQVIQKIIWLMQLHKITQNLNVRISGLPMP